MDPRRPATTSEGYSGRGRPSRISQITEGDWTKIERAISVGAPYIFVCGYAQVTLTTWNNWLAKGRSEIAEGKESVYADFLVRVEGCKRDHIVEALAEMKANPRGHEGHKWVLSRRHPEQFHQGHKVEHSGQVNGNHTVTVFDAAALDRLETVDDLTIEESEE